MEAESNIKLTMVFGSVKIVPEYRILKDGSMLLGSYSITYDENGRFVSRTEPTWNVRITTD